MSCPRTNGAANDAANDTALWQLGGPATCPFGQPANWQIGINLPRPCLNCVRLLWVRCGCCCTEPRSAAALPLPSQRKNCCTNGQRAPMDWARGSSWQMLAWAGFKLFFRLDIWAPLRKIAIIARHTRWPRKHDRRGLGLCRDALSNPIYQFIVEDWPIRTSKAFRRMQCCLNGQS